VSDYYWRYLKRIQTRRTAMMEMKCYVTQVVLYNYIGLTCVTCVTLRKFYCIAQQAQQELQKDTQTSQNRTNFKYIDTECHNTYVVLPRYYGNCRPRYCRFPPLPPLPCSTAALYFSSHSVRHLHSFMLTGWYISSLHNRTRIHLT